jgi:trehalose 6-phosphate phosphatase
MSSQSTAAPATSSASSKQQSLDADSGSSSPRPLNQLTYDPATSAMMLDFDGTLVDIAPTPDSIQFSSEDAALLAKLEDAHGGAVAIVSGRAIDDLEQYLTSFGGLIAGGHGAEFRIDGRRSLAGEVDESQLEEIKQAVISFGKSDPRILLEHKSTGIVMHYRAHPECESDVIELAKSLVEKRPDFKLQFAKMAVEIKPAAASKASAMEALLQEKPVSGRRIFFAGDDVTDESAFEWVNAQGGITVKIGDEETSAGYRCSDPTEFKAWLKGVAQATPADQQS